MNNLCPCGRTLKKGDYTFCVECVIILKMDFNISIEEAQKLTTRQVYKMSKKSLTKCKK